MALPEMYRHSKRHEYFGTKLFLIYMFEALCQVRRLLVCLTARRPNPSIVPVGHYILLNSVRLRDDHHTVGWL